MIWIVRERSYALLVFLIFFEQIQNQQNDDLNPVLI